ncbi:TonB-dependent receptor [Carboxylicivirga sediminis]|uniref:TonB-dependent receptor n=1 Tax=Carboxylicivirga sediminis TaxID=2006564 RepID=A0A941FCB3_9BACT|nr:TonB-dependent receptor [Carboxylicivirga sediminis]MBR8538279.1 TonB-dependent receptor [Carboxylicivirga sediminis]
MLNKFTYLIAFFAFNASYGWAQLCNNSLVGHVVDQHSGDAIAYAAVAVEGTNKGTITEEDGSFVLMQLCNSDKVLHVSCVGYKRAIINLDSFNGGNLHIQLVKAVSTFDEIVVNANYLSEAQQATKKVNSEDISQGANQNLAGLLEAVSGISSLKSGGGVSKPVVHGLYGNRLPILNNGIAQSGQQWGNDHSPEIDPLVANTISVLNGVDALEYQGRSLGSMVLVEPARISALEQLNGQSNIFFESNGRGAGLNLQLQQSAPGLAWKVNGTLKKRGDQHAANYFLTNTGVEEANIAAQLEKKINEQWYIDAYLSSFNTQIGILRGSHIGNITDLEEALKRDVPFYTKENFSYAIDAPRQTVQHHLLKLHAKHLINSRRWVHLTYATQFNNRKEFDVRKGDRSDIPAMSLTQFSHYLKAGYTSLLRNNWRWKAGLQFTFIDNTNQPETGILPLIPDYNSYEIGLYSSFSKKMDYWDFDFGLRYDRQIQNVAAISTTVPREILRYNNLFSSYKLALQAKNYLSEGVYWLTGVNLGTRNPEVNELYSNGLHQGVGGIEEGDSTLKPETGIKVNALINGQWWHKVQLETDLYYQYIDNYIFLNPQDEIRLTIRGAFPVFKYEQTMAHIYGADLNLSYLFSSQLKVKGQYSYLRGHNISDNEPLIYMPSNQLRFSFTYELERMAGLENVTIEGNYQYVFRQNHLQADQDYVLPPDGYGLIGVRMSADKRFKHHRLQAYVKFDNLLNKAYRDYMNRMRYFADDLGRNAVIGLNIYF